jgi:TonB family protein
MKKIKLAAALASLVASLALADQPIQNPSQWPRRRDGIDVQACVGPDGRLTAEPAIAKSSGSSLLDQGALETIKAADGKYYPASADGKPIAKCFVYHVSGDGHPGHGFPSANLFYPPLSQHLHEGGAVEVGVCVGPDGKLTIAPAIAKSSGIKRLDNGALSLAKAGDGEYTPGIDDAGRPVASCFIFRVTFVP